MLRFEDQRRGALRVLRPGRQRRGSRDLLGRRVQRQAVQDRGPDLQGRGRPLDAGAHGRGVLGARRPHRGRREAVRGEQRRHRERRGLRHDRVRLPGAAGLHGPGLHHGPHQQARRDHDPEGRRLLLHHDRHRRGQVHPPGHLQQRLRWHVLRHVRHRRGRRHVRRPERGPHEGHGRAERRDAEAPQQAARRPPGHEGPQGSLRLVPLPHSHGAQRHRHRRALQAPRVVRHVRQQAGHARQRQELVRGVPRGGLRHRPVPDAHLLPHRGRRFGVPAARVAGGAHGEHDPAGHPVAAERVRAHRRDRVAFHPGGPGGEQGPRAVGRRDPRRPHARPFGRRHRG